MSEASLEPTGVLTADPDMVEQRLVSRVLATLLREDVVGLRSQSTQIERPDGRWLRLAGPEALLLAVTADGFLCTDTAREPLLLCESDGRKLRTTSEIISALAESAHPLDRPGFEEFAAECDRARAAMQLHSATHGRFVNELVGRYGDRIGDWTGLASSLAFDALAARHDHPVYPTSRGRSGLDETDLLTYAPEFHPRFTLRWLAVPHAAVTSTGDADFPPQYWPVPTQLGLPQLADSHVMLPIHPASVGALEGILRELGLYDECVLAEPSYLTVIPTLSMRTVAVADAPTEHLKLPLATATLGGLNVRTIKPRTLIDGAEGQRLLAAVLDRESGFVDRILLAEESCYAHAGHELLAVLRRRYPPGLDGAVVVPMAALLAAGPDGRLVLDHLADRFYNGAPIALFDAWITLLFRWQTTLFGYGVALESHQQNISLVLDHHRESTRLRLLLKDNDTPRVHTARLRGRLGDIPVGFDDPRIAVDDDRGLTDLFTTITLHLCAGAYAFELARLGYAPQATMLGLVRDRLEQAIDGLDATAAARLRADVLNAPRLPVKAMVSAGTLFSKERSGAVDINKHYTDGPNYLRTAGEHT
ncbi:IucA/IucC family protein [Nocardia brevicatena]|uniref:IucA/IucC family protein n=1 Tax=Nocardia brevicatena TaxID=37327 RepID=UPI0002E8AFE1|nr:IucA/IucC family protein [Nocardia brevicatena]